MSKFGVDLIYKVSFQFISLLIGLLSLGIVARSLNPVYYGSFNYLTDFFRRFQKLIMGGSMTGYFIQLSKKNNGHLILSYHVYLLILLPIVLVLLGLVFSIGYTEFFFPDQEVSYILMAAIFVLLTLQGNGLSSTYDALGLTKYFEVIKLIPLIVSVTCILALYSFSKLNLFNYFLLNILSQLGLFIIGTALLVRLKKFNYFAYKSNKEGIRKNLKKIFKFSRLLFIYGFFVFITYVLERWLLQNYFGSYEQGIYGFALKISSMILLIGAPLSRLFLRESSYRITDLSKFARYIQKGLILNLFIGLFLGFFVGIYGLEIITIIGGSQYFQSHLGLYLLAISVGINFSILFLSSLILAEENSLLHMKINLPVILLFFLFSFILLTTNTNFLISGFNILPLKQLLMYISNFVILLFICAKKFNFSFFKYMNYSLLFSLFAFLIGSFSSFLASLFFEGDFMKLILGGMIYGVMSLLFLICINNIFRLNISFMNLIK